MKKVVLYGIAGMFLFSSCVSKKNFDQLQTEKNELEARMESMRTDFEAQLSELKSSNEVLSSDKDNLSKEMASIEKKLQKNESKVSEVEFKLKDKQYQIDQIWNELDASFSNIDKAVTASNSRISELEDLLYLDVDNPVNFRSGSSNIDPSDKEQLQKLAEMLKSNPEVTLIVEGHTDSRSISTEKYSDNWDLSVSRSTMVVRQLLKMGVNPEQLVASGRAEYKPNVEEDRSDPSTLSANRRTEFILVPNIGKLYKVFKKGKVKP